MSDTDKRTKAELLAELEASDRRVETAEAAAYRYRGQLEAGRTAPTAVAEADALAQCIRALDILTERKDSSRGYGYGNSYGIAYSGDYSTRQQTEVERVLRTLAAKYAVPLVEVRTEPCHRRHLDEIDASMVMQALGAGGRF